MNNENLRERITINPKVMVGKPVIKGTRLTVEYIQGLLAHGATTEEILEEYPGGVSWRSILEEYPGGVSRPGEG